MDFFVDTLYKDYYTPEAIAKIKGINYASGKLNALAMEAQKNGYQLFLIVDEYDNFTNVVLNEHGEDVYWALTHAVASIVRFSRYSKVCSPVSS